MTATLDQLRAQLGDPQLTPDQAAAFERIRARRARGEYPKPGDPDLTTYATAILGRRPHALSERETRVLTLLAAGRTIAAVARQMDSSERTVRRHVTSAAAKLGGTCLVHTVALAVAAGYIVPVPVRGRA